MKTSPSILWFRHDLRLEDQPALIEAVAKGGAVVPVFIWAAEEEDRWAPGAASRWWLHQSLQSLKTALQKKGSNLILRKGPSSQALRDVVSETGADTVVWNRRYEPAVTERDARIESELQSLGVTVRTFNASLLFEPWDIANKQGNPYKVFTPYWKQCLASEEPAEPQPAPKKIPPPKDWPASVALEDLALEPEIDWAKGMRSAWTPGENGAEAELSRFLEEGLHAYPTDRDRPDRVGTSRMSPHLHFGELSPRMIWHAVRDHAATVSRQGLVRGAESYLRELGWREFAHHLLYSFPDTCTRPLRPEFEDFPWEEDAEGLRAWQKGMTGYPIVDAGMRELWETGWMHNRVRMIVASFLVKDLLVPWQEGAKWFWDTLVDADLANNTLGWQWTAGCGADAAPYFRVFNPVLQGGKFDPAGSYVSRWVPELRALPTKWIHKPWAAPEPELKKACVVLGESYPHPVVDHAAARDRALEAYGAIKQS